MKFNERLRLARENAQLTQLQLIERLGNQPDGRPLMSQANLAKMESNPKANGTKFVALIAKICGVNAVWLTSGEGEMLDIPYSMNRQQRQVHKAMQKMPESQQDAMVKIGNSLAQPDEDKGGA